MITRGRWTIWTLVLNPLSPLPIWETFISGPAASRVLLLCPGNPLRCQCEQQELWYWLQDHQRQVDRGPRCEGPPQLRGLWFLGLEPPEFCSLPLVPRLHLDRILASSLGVSWDSQNNSGVTAFAVAYHTLESPSKVRSQHYFQQMLSISFNSIQ